MPRRRHLSGSSSGAGPAVDAAVAQFRARLAALDSAQVAAFDAGTPAQVLVRGRAASIDALLTDAWRRFELDGWPGLALVAVGGYGRGELHPGSDIDVMILHGGDELPEECIGAFLTFLWDIGLELGHSVRTVAECSSEAQADITVATNLLEARVVIGDAAAFAAMRASTGPDQIWPSRAFFEAKWEEQRTRHHRFFDTAYNLEPNVKEGPGGLRDLQMIGWVVKRHFGAETLHELVEEGFLTEPEYLRLLECQQFLWQVRFALHVISGRREDRLLFDHQRDVAARLGFDDAEHLPGVERLMQQYYRTIRALSRLNEMLLELFQEVILMSPEAAVVEPLNRRFQVRNGFLEATRDNVFSRYPFALLEMFLLLQQHPEVKGVRATTIRLVRENLHRINDDFRADIRARSLFLEIIRQPRGITHEFQRMHDYGVLAAYLPQFGNVVGRMQYDLFHAYTVDQHTLFVVRNLRCFFVPERFHEFPRCSALVSRLPKPELLYLGGLFHDIAKGRGGDHSELGAADARAFCVHHGMSDFDADFVAWLVRNHLLMSVTAQRKDISDPEVVVKFARQIGDRMHLDYLYLLTVADIRATNPKLWNSWKDSLLWDLYQSTVRVLRLGAERPVDAADLVHETQNGARRLLGAKIPLARLAALWDPLGDDYFLRNTSDEIAWHAQGILEAGLEDLPLVVARRGRGGLEIFLYAPDSTDLFAACTAALDRLGVNILDARIITARNDMTLDSFVVEAPGQTLDEGFEDTVRRALRDALRPSDGAMPAATRMPPRALRHFTTATEIRFDADPDRQRTVMEVITGDRPGLLARIGWALASCHVSLQSAKIATFGERAEDVFYLCDRETGALSDAQTTCLSEHIRRALDEADPPQARAPTATRSSI